MQPSPARATAAIVVVTALAWAAVAAAGLGPRAAYVGGFIPARLSGAPEIVGALPAWLTPLTATLLHSGLAHVGFNLLLIGFCGRAVELALGARGLVILYLAGAYAAALGQYALAPDEFTPMIGASGAGSALLGTYAVLYGARKAGGRAGALLNMLWLVAAWIGIQLLFGFAMGGEGLTIAIGAHVGGFLAGLLLARPLLLLRYRRT